MEWAMDVASGMLCPGALNCLCQKGQKCICDFESASIKCVCSSETYSCCFACKYMNVWIHYTWDCCTDVCK